MENAGIRNLMDDLNERQKELSCLYKVSGILKSSGESLNEVLLKVVEVLPTGYRFPDFCKVQIICKEHIVQSEGFKVTELKQTAKIKSENIEVGKVTVIYAKPVKFEIGSIFLSEEQKLINAVAEEIGQYITLYHFRELTKNSKKVSEKYNIPVALGNWFSDLHLKESEIYKIVRPVSNFKKGEVILKQGASVSHLFILTEGLAKLFVEDFKNRSFIFKLCKPFEIIGLSSIFGKENYGFTVAAVLPSRGYMVNINTVKSIIEKNSEFNSVIHNWYCENLNLSYSKLNFLANKQALGRIASTLLYLQNDIFEGQVIENSITRKIIADLSGMSTENTVRILSELKKDGIINIRKEGIQILNHELLETYSIVG